MTERRQEDRAPETGPPDGLVEVLGRWEHAGGHWTVLTTTEAWIEIGLFTCDGAEQMGQVSGARTSVLCSFLADRLSSTD